MRQAAVETSGVDMEHFGVTGHCRVSLHHGGRLVVGMWVGFRCLTGFVLS